MLEHLRPIRWAAALAALVLLGQPCAAQTSDSTVCTPGLVGIPGRSEADRTEIMDALSPADSASLEDMVWITASRDMPHLMNAGAVTRSIRRLYPRALRVHGVGGEARVLARIDETGRVGHLRALSGIPELAGVAIEVIREMRFRPASYLECPVPVWVILPVTFSPGDTGTQPSVLDPVR